MLRCNLIVSLGSMLEHVHLRHHFKGGEISGQRCEAICPHAHPWGSLPPPPFSPYRNESLEAQKQRVKVSRSSM